MALKMAKRTKQSPLAMLRELHERLSNGFGGSKVSHQDALVSCRFVADELWKIIRKIELDIKKAQ